MEDLVRKALVTSSPCDLTFSVTGAWPSKIWRPWKVQKQVYFRL